MDAKAPKDALAVIIARKAGEAKAQKEGASESANAEQAAGAEILNAVKAGDASAFTSSLRNFVKACMADYGDED